MKKKVERTLVVEGLCAECEISATVHIEGDTTDKDFEEGEKFYEHYKTKNIYEMLGIGKHSETEEELVIYKSLKDGKIWARPRAMFFGTVEIEGESYYRFALVPKYEAEKFVRKLKKNGT